MAKNSVVRLGPSIAVTLDLYSHFALDGDADAAELVAERINGTPQ